MHILEIETFGRGGLIHYAYNLSAALADRGHKITLATVDIPPGVRVVEVLGRIGHRLGSSLPYSARALPRKVEAVRDAIRIAALARRLQPDVIHLHCTNPIALLYLGCLQRLKMPLVATAHVVTPHEPIRFQKSIHRWLHGLGDLIIDHSRVDTHRLLTEFGVRADRVVEIPHGE